MPGSPRGHKDTKTLRVWGLAFRRLALSGTLVSKLFIWFGEILFPLLVSLVSGRHKGKFTENSQAGLLC